MIKFILIYLLFSGFFLNSQSLKDTFELDIYIDNLSCNQEFKIGEIIIFDHKFKEKVLLEAKPFENIKLKLHCKSEYSITIWFEDCIIHPINIYHDCSHLSKIKMKDSIYVKLKSSIKIIYDD